MTVSDSEYFEPSDDSPDPELLAGLENRTSAGAGELIRYLRPYLRPVRKLITGSIMFGLVALLAAAAIPLVVEDALQHGVEAHALGTLALLMLVDIAMSWAGQRLSYRAAASMARHLTAEVYAATLESPMMRQIGLRRPSVISRHTSDIDRIEEAVDVTLDEGLPGVLRIILSLGLLYYVEPRAGVIMIIGTLLFLIVYSVIGRGLLTVDKARLDASSDVGALVDESITAARNASGMNLLDWMRERLAERIDRLHRATIVQKRQARRLVVAARTVGHIALFGVIVAALIGGESEAGAIAAALLYIDAVVRGLEALPPWLRDGRLAVTSKRRIEQITRALPRVNRESPNPEAPEPGLAIHDMALEPDNLLTLGTLRLPTSGIVAIVPDAGMAPSRLLEVLGGDGNADAGCVTLDGTDVRHPMVKRRVVLLTHETFLMDATVREHLRAADPTITAEGVTTALAKAGLSHLEDLPNGGVDARLGTHAETLSVHERQRLLLAMAMTSNADIVMVETLALLADVDVALPLLASIAGQEQRLVIVATRSPDLASRAGHVIALFPDEILCAPHSELMGNPKYSGIWDRQSAMSADTRILESIPDAQRDSMRSRIATEQFPAGETLFRSGSPADQIMYIITGRVAVLATDADGIERRVAEIGPGNFCGDIDRPGTRHSNTVRAVHDTLVRTLSVEAWSAGVMGLLDADPVERRVVTAVLRSANATDDAIMEMLPDVEPAAVTDAIESLLSQSALRRSGDGVLSISARRRSLAGSAALLDRLVD
ncbi:MAG: cyclic nucleotide-binding domain-containing protein [Actinobacteria bacterium]|nr:cyclic nucleotide-binding domain-containing protein [Actinomycetota bacterium]